MSLQLIQEDITKIEVDAIVNPTDESYSGSGGIDQLVHRSAGNELNKECKKLAPLKVGEAVITKAYNLKTAQYIIHTHGPKYIDGCNNEETDLRRCYESALKLAKEYNIESIALPLISTGGFGFPKDKAKYIAKEVCEEFNANNDIDIYLLIFGKNEPDYSCAIFEDIVREINNNGVFLSEENKRKYLRTPVEESKNIPVEDISSLDNLESFNDYFKRIIKEKKMNEIDVRKASNLTRQAFNKICKQKSDPKRENALALAMGLKLDLTETKEFMEMAGYSFGKRRIDIIVGACIKKHFYDVEKLNDFLFSNNLPTLLGSRNPD